MERIRFHYTINQNANYLVHKRKGKSCVPFIFCDKIGKISKNGLRLSVFFLKTVNYMENVAVRLMVYGSSHNMHTILNFILNVSGQNILNVKIYCFKFCF